MRKMLIGLAAILVSGLLLTGTPAVGEQAAIDVGFTHIRSEELVVAVAPNQNSVWAYSATAGEWKKQPLQGIVDPKTPVVGNMIAAVHTSSHVYAFSAKTGTWAALEIPDDAPVRLIVELHKVIAEAPGALHIFSEESGEWASLTVKDLEQE